MRQERLGGRRCDHQARFDHEPEVGFQAGSDTLVDVALRAMFKALRAIDRRASLVVPANDIYGQDARPSATLERAFFEGVRLTNGTFKTTADGRLDDLNSMIIEHLSPRQLRAKDVAVSSGITTVEWYESLRAAGFSCEMTATDIQTQAALIECSGGLKLLVDRRGTPMQIDVAGFAFRPDNVGRRERLIYALPLAIAALLKRCDTSRSCPRAWSPIRTCG